jgi:hypothetical protein
MKSEKLETVKGSGNVFRDLGHKHADAEQLRAAILDYATSHNEGQRGLIALC